MNKIVGLMDCAKINSFGCFCDTGVACPECLKKGEVMPFKVKENLKKWKK